MSFETRTSGASVLPPGHPLQTGLTSGSALVTTYQGVRGPVTPFWMMRQAGRSLPEYRELRIGTDMLDACLDPAMASEITLQPWRRHGVDAGIFFSDIVVPIRLAGVDVSIVAGKGPVLARAVRTARDVAELPELDEAALAPISEAVALTVAELGSTPLIGFAGAPFTLAAYLVEGGPSKDHLAARAMMHADPEAWQALMEWTSRITGAFLSAQVQAGASAAQLFDSWAGALSLKDYTEKVAPASAAALSRVHGLGYTVGANDTDPNDTDPNDTDPNDTDENDTDANVDGADAADGSRVAAAAAAAQRTDAADGAGVAVSSGDARRRTVPIVHFGVGTGELLGAMHDVGADVMGVDWRLPLDEASRRLGGTVPLQGNIDPALLGAPWPVLEAHVLDVLDRGLAAPSHVLNLGHGVPPDTDPAVLTRLVAFVHSVAGAADASSPTPARTSSTTAGAHVATASPAARATTTSSVAR